MTKVEAAQEIKRIVDGIAPMVRNYFREKKQLPVPGQKDLDPELTERLKPGMTEIDRLLGLLTEG